MKNEKNVYTLRVAFPLEAPGYNNPKEVESLKYIIFRMLGKPNCVEPAGYDYSIYYFNLSKGQAEHRRRLAKSLKIKDLETEVYKDSPMDAVYQTNKNNSLEKMAVKALGNKCQKCGKRYSLSIKAPKNVKPNAARDWKSLGALTDGKTGKYKVLCQQCV